MSKLDSAEENKWKHMVNYGKNCIDKMPIRPAPPNEEKYMKHAREDYNRIQDPAELIPEDEPVFLLRAQDRTAPEILRAWGEANLKLDDRDDNAIQKAYDQAYKMEQWQQEHRCKTADI